MRHAVDADVPALRAIASHSHQASRFYADPGFPLERCDALYAEWIERSVREDLADAVLVAAEGSQALGYVTCSVDALGVGQIGLFAVAREARGRGYGGQLVQAALGLVSSSAGSSTCRSSLRATTLVHWPFIIAMVLRPTRLSCGITPGRSYRVSGADYAKRRLRAAVHG